MSAEQVTRRSVVTALAILPLASAARAGSSATSFVAIGDWGRKGAVPQRKVAAAMAEAAKEIGSRFVLSVGDNFYPCGVKSVADPHWKASFEDVYTAPSLQTPWYAALGNHDYRGVPQAQVDYSRLSPRWRMPSRYFKLSGPAVSMAGLDIFVIDSSALVGGSHETVEQLAHGHVWRCDPDDQMRWLEAELARSTASWKIVVGHHPVFSGSHGDNPFLVERVRPLLERYGVQAYLNGHDHDLQHIKRGAVSYVCTGAGAQARPVVAVEGTQFCLSRPGFAMFVLQADALQLEFRDLEGASLYRTSIAVGRA